MSQPNPYQPPESIAADDAGQRAAEETKQQLVGLGGWLILVGIGVVLSPVRIMGQIFVLCQNIFLTGAWEELTTPGTQSYNPLWAPIILGELAINITFTVIWFFIAYLFFSKKQSFPKWYIAIVVIGLVFIVLDAFAVTLVLPQEPVFDPDTVKEFFRSLVGAFIWIPYMLVSKRVKATFVN